MSQGKKHTGVCKHMYLKQSSVADLLNGVKKKTDKTHQHLRRASGLNTLCVRRVNTVHFQTFGLTK